MSETSSKSAPLVKNELASSESLQKLDQRHEELLVKLDALTRELETALANLLPKQEAPPLKDAA
jgi:hypothetical protein